MTIATIKEKVDGAEPVKISDEERFQSLASLSKTEYDRVRINEAERLGIRVATLDEEVENKRKAQSKTTYNEQTLLFPDIEPWPNPVDIEDILGEIRTTLNKYAVLPPHADVAITLWIAFTWVIDSMNIAPILVLSSPEKQCGKTTLLSLISHLVKRPIPTSNITPAALFRSIEAWHPTLIIDEGCTFINKSEDLRGILNCGHSRATAYVIRTVGESHEPKSFNTWGAKVIALIGKLPDTLHDRSFVIQMKRKKSEETVTPFRIKEQIELLPLQQKLCRFAQDNTDLLKKINPKLPDSISDRAKDNWEPLFAIAQLAGEKWASYANQAALALSSRLHDATNIGIDLLCDIREIFMEKHINKISTDELISNLCLNEERPWSTFHQGQQITPRQLANALQKYGIQSKSMRFNDGSNLKGYDRTQFEDAWLRYLPSNAPIYVTPLQTKQIANPGVSDNSNVTSQVDISVTTSVNELASCDGVMDRCV